MAKRTFRFQVSRFNTIVSVLAFVLAVATFHPAAMTAQLPSGTPLYNVNSKWVTDKGSQVYNVMAYGAKCDGTTDDSAAIQNAIYAANPGSTFPNYVNHPGAGVTLIPGGCAIANSIHVRGILTGIGESDTSHVEASSYLIWTGAAGQPMLIIDSRYSSVRDIALYGNTTNVPSDAILISNVSGSSYGEMGRIENVQIGLSNNMEFTNGISWNGTVGGDNFVLNKIFISGVTNAGINNPTNGNASDEEIDNLSVNYASIGVLEQGFVTGSNWAFSYVNTELVLGQSGGGTAPYVIVRGYVGGGTPMSGTGMLATVYAGTLHITDGGYSMVTSTASPVLDSHYTGDTNVWLENFNFQSAGAATTVALNLCTSLNNGAQQTFRLINVSGVNPSNITCSTPLTGQGYKNSILIDFQPAPYFGYYADPSRTITTWETGNWDWRRTDETHERDLWGGPSVIHQLNSPNYPLCTPTGSGSTSYGYRITSLTTTSYFSGESLPGAEVTCSNASTLSGSSYNTITWQSVVGATGYNIYCRTPGSELLCGTVWGSGTNANTWADTGSVTPSGALPTVNTTGGLYGVYDYIYNGSYNRLTNWSIDGNGNANFAGTMQAAQVSAAKGTSCTNGELVLSSGWGASASVSGVAGTGQTCSWTITANGTTAASPTLTDTLTNALPSAAVVCDMRMVGGTGTATLINQSTMSATAPVFTFNGTPASGSTYMVVRRCGP
jgi:hypothetical protein